MENKLIAQVWNRVKKIADFRLDTGSGFKVRAKQSHHHPLSPVESTTPRRVSAMGITCIEIERKYFWQIGEKNHA